jgi:hypothetical protein
MAIPTEIEKGKLAAQTVAKLFADDALRSEFMKAYASSPDSIASFLMDRLELPEEFADEIVSKQSQELSNYIGKLICDYLW